MNSFPYWYIIDIFIMLFRIFYSLLQFGWQFYKEMSGLGKIPSLWVGISHIYPIHDVFLSFDEYVSQYTKFNTPSIASLYSIRLRRKTIQPMISFNFVNITYLSILNRQHSRAQHFKVGKNRLLKLAPSSSSHHQYEHLRFISSLIIINYSYRRTINGLQSDPYKDREKFRWLNLLTILHQMLFKPNFYYFYQR